LTEADWSERVSKRVSANLIDWLSKSSGGIPGEVVPPTFPAALKLTQDKWESDAEFESRVATARRERQAEIEQIQTDYKRKVDARNIQIAASQRRRSELERALPLKRLELIEEALRSEGFPLKLVSTDFDPQRALLFLKVSIGGRDLETYEYKESPPELRRTALTKPENLELKPVFYISDTGEFGLRAILVKADQQETSGTPANSSAQRQTPLTATITVPEPAAPIANQSTIAVDRNQIEQILYREENDALRKRLDEQRRAQELALAEQTTRASAETARLKAQAEAALQRQKELEQQLAKAAAPPKATEATQMAKRKALIIGNDSYKFISKLANAREDARAVAENLAKVGYTVTLTPRVTQIPPVKVTQIPPP
jgi:translation initiation factor 3 subunit A